MTNFTVRKRLRRVKWAGLALLHAGASWAAPVCAQPTATASPPSLSPADEQRALDLFEAGKRAYREGRFQDAIERLRQAYDLSHQAVLRYDLARAYEGLGDIASAAREYEAYLAEEQSIPDRAGIAQRAATLRQELAERERLMRAQRAAEQRAESARATQPAAGTEVAPPPRASSSSPPWPWLVIGVGVAGIAAGGVASAVALSYHADAARAGTAQDAVATDNDRANGWITAARVAFVAGGVAAAAGLTWWFFTRDRGRGSGAHAGVQLFPHRVSLSVEWF